MNPACRKYRLLREAAYEAGRAEFQLLAHDPSFRDFVCLYIAEGSKRNRNRVAIGNSDPSMIALCTRWIARFAGGELSCDGDIIVGISRHSYSIGSRERAPGSCN